MSSGEETSVLGKTGFGSDPFTRDLYCVPGIHQIRVRVGGIETTTPWEIEFKST
jgi:hypothetical protein